MVGHVHPGARGVDDHPRADGGLPTTDQVLQHDRAVLDARRADVVDGPTVVVGSGRVPDQLDAEPFGLGDPGVPVGGRRDNVGLEPGDLPPANLTVDAVYPNPFNPSTSVKLYIPRDSDLELAVYDVQGRRIRRLHSGGISSGWHTMVWDGRDDSGRGSSSGMYFLRAMNESDVTVQKMTLVK